MKSMIDVDFEFFGPNPSIDYQAIKRLLVQLFQRDADLFHLHELTELILSQSHIGTTVKTDGQESDPYALLTVINMHMHQENPSIKALVAYFLQKSASNPTLRAQLQNLFSQTENHVGLVICERLINMPVQVVPPMYQMLKDELNVEASPNHPFKFSYLIIPSRTYYLSTDEETYLTNMKESKTTSKKKKTKVSSSTISRPADGVYSFHPEDEHLKQVSNHTIEYTFTSAPTEPRDSESFGLDTRGRMMFMPFAQFESLLLAQGKATVQLGEPTEELRMRDNATETETPPFHLTQTGDSYIHKPTRDMSFFQPAPEPPSKLGVYRVLSPRAGVRVSPICLGAMSIGDKWNQFMGSMDKEASFKLLDAYYDNGGNFIDTANNYQGESSEQFIGEWMEKRGIRDEIVIATKYTINYKMGNSSVKQQVNYTGNNKKSLHISVEASLKKLRTSYIDILYVHWWDFDTTIEEVMDSLHNLVASGKVLYLGISDTPAWIVAQANQYAKDHAKTPFIIYQGKWNVLERDFERDIIPMARSLGLALAPWSVLAGGKLRTDEEEERRRKTGEKGRDLGQGWERTEDQAKMSRTLEKVAKDVGAKNISAVAIAYVMQKTPYVFPIIGGRKVENLIENLEALNISLTDEHIKELESVIPFDVGFPTSFIGDGSESNFLLKATAKMERIPYSKALGRA
ncbi:hypothetical protein D9757_006790 [Collybiopsis confluens]|uniref:NADP-dependent oxidoreductase domain-containing protein n=1 Tax=Collybiopsis confluens TaxID=2823264 RepID=A0A8H5HLY2_9AGAR|nr:hypothetical protein D9757_006790 [Collybiopsis confluens]